jgi:putative ABC transport system permease protein
MLKSYLVIAFRNLARQKVYAFINIFGLAVGMACCLVIFLYVRHELSFDRYHAKADRIFRVNSEDWAPTPPIIAPTLETDFPDLIEHAVRFYQPDGGRAVQYEDRLFWEMRVSYAEPAVFDVFTYPMLRGNPETALTRPQTAVLTESAALKYFGDEDPLGKILLIGDGTLHPYEVTGVVKDLPSNTYFRFDFLLSFNTLGLYMGDALESWSWGNFYNYVLLKEGVAAADLESRLPSFMERHTGSAYEGGWLQPVSDIYLNPQPEQEWFPTGNALYVYLLTTIAVFVLLIACVNFMNLSTARATQRAQEIGMRKALGALRRQLAFQFLGEAVLLSLFALGISVALVELTLPALNTMAGKSLETDYLSNPATLVGMVGFATLVGFCAGSYPAFLISGFNPISVLKNQHAARSTHAGLRKGLVIAQFTISSCLFTGTAIVFQQLGYMQSTALGFDREHLVTLSAPDYPRFRQAVESLAGVQQVTSANLVPGQGFDVWPLWADGMDPDSAVSMRLIRADYDFVETLGIKIAQGRDFSPDRTADAQNSFLLNEAAARQFAETLGWTDPVGRPFALFDWDGQGEFSNRRPGTVIGVVEDFNFTSLHREVEPLAIMLNAGWGQTVLRLKPGATATLAQIEAVWKQLFPGRPFTFEFVDQQIDAQYRAEQRLSQVLGVFTGLAFLIACLGLFGLAAFTAERRTKEIGIRKVLGASVSSIVALLSKDFVRLVLIAIVIATPIAYFSMQWWLDDFAYRIEIGPGIFALAGVLALLIALATVSYQAIKAALADPVKSLRYE